MKGINPCTRSPGKPKAVVHEFVVHGSTVGFIVGLDEGDGEGWAVGETEGAGEGALEGDGLGAALG